MRHEINKQENQVRIDINTIMVKWLTNMGIKFANKTTASLSQKAV